MIATTWDSGGRHLKKHCFALFEFGNKFHALRAESLIGECEWDWLIYLGIGGIQKLVKSNSQYIPKK